MRVEGKNEDFTVATKTEKGIEAKYHARKIAVATGYYDLPNLLGVSGENLPHVSHYYNRAPCLLESRCRGDRRKNSAAEAALDLYRNGARVTLVHRNKDWAQASKYWVRPDIENRIKAGQVKACLRPGSKRSRTEEVVVENGAGEMNCLRDKCSR